MNNSIHVDGLVMPVEVVRRRKFHTVAPAAFVRKMMQSYGCKGGGAIYKARFFGASQVQTL